MTANERSRLKVLRLAGATMFSVYKGGLYFFSFLGPALAVRHFSYLPAPALLALVIVGFGIAGFVFLSLLVLTRKLLIGSVPMTGLTTVLSEDGKKVVLGRAHDKLSGP